MDRGQYVLNVRHWFRETNCCHCPELPDARSQGKHPCADSRPMERHVQPYDAIDAVAVSREEGPVETIARRWGQADCASRWVQRAQHGVLMMLRVCRVQQPDEEAAVTAVSEKVVSAEAGAADGGGELWGLRDGQELRPRRPRVAEVEAEEVGRVEVAEAAEEGRVRGVPKPALGDEGGAYQAVGEAEAAEKVVVTDHRRDRGRRRRRRCRRVWAGCGCSPPTILRAGSRVRWAAETSASTRSSAGGWAWGRSGRKADGFLFFF